MRRTGWLLLAGCLALAGAVGWIFQQQKAEQTKAAPKRPDSLPKGMQSVADNWRWSKNEGDRPIVEVTAKRFAQQNDPPRVDLEIVELKLFHKDGKQFDLVKSNKAELRLNDNLLYSDGDVEITMGMQSDPEARNRLVTIHTSGVSFDTATGRASTDRKASFLFENSEGSSTGAAYDPALRELTMLSAVQLHWSKSAKPMDVEAGHLIYKEVEQKIYLSPWSKLRRDTLTLNAAASVVNLEQGQITLVEAEKAKGEDRQPKRTLEYAADKLVLHFAEKSVVKHIDALGQARIANISPSGKTTVTADTVNLDFLTPDSGSVLQKAHATGNTRVESTPPNSAARILKSNVVELTMRTGGEEIDQVVTHAPGEIEFLPKKPEDRYRKMTGERFWITYGPANQIEKFRAAKVTTFTKGKPKLPDAITSSQDLDAKFDPKTGDMTMLEQWTAFRYEEGDRRARAAHARLEQPSDQITLTGGARVWDLTGSTDADLIELDQKSGNMIATGKVSSTRLPDEKKSKPKSSLVDSSSPTQARAEKMSTRDDNQWIRYEGGATLWQGADRVEAQIITIDRKAQTLTAAGNVFTQTRERPKPTAKNPQPQLFTLVRAPNLVYNDAEKLAHYTGGVTLNRGELKVTSKELRAIFSKDDPKTPDDEGNNLQLAIADGAVDIFQSAADRIRTGKSEHAEYQIPEAVIILTGGAPVFNDSLKGTTRGQKLTWFADNDKLLVDGAPPAPAVSRIKRKSSAK